MADMKLEAWLTGGLNRLSRTIDNRDLVMREGEEAPKPVIDPYPQSPPYK